MRFCTMDAGQRWVRAVSRGCQSLSAAAAPVRGGKQPPAAVTALMPLPVRPAVRLGEVQPWICSAPGPH